MTKLTKTAIEAAEPQEKQITLWCGELKGFGAFIQPSGTRSYFVDYRNAKGKRRRLALGRHGTITAEQARKMALEKLGSIVRGSDPLDDRSQIRKSQTVKQLCEHYLDMADSVTKSRMCSGASRVGGVSTPAKTDARGP